MKYYYWFILLGLVLSSCSDKDTPQDNSLRDDEIPVITVRMHNVSGASGDLSDMNSDSEVVYPQNTIINNRFDENSLLYFSQMGSSTDPNFSDFTNSASPYCFIYEYYQNDDATWDSNDEYNFKICQTTQYGDDRLPITWKSIMEIGSVKNSFSLYAFHFPVANTVRWNVETDQSVLDNFKVSDIMGAYHATSALYTRLRFNLFHLMVYLKITLYVPDYEEYADVPGDYAYSGYKEGSYRGAYVMNAYPGINIEWRTDRSSDINPPLTQPNTSMSRANIKMYQHPGSNEVITLENVKSFYPNYSGADNTDRVRVYEMSVLVPAQTFGNDFLCFGLIDAEGNNRYYYFNGNQITGDSGNYSLTQGTLQELKLYLPRATNETILMGANVLPWNDAATDMTVTKQNTFNP